MGKPGLGTRVFLVVAGVNAGVFGVAGGVLFERLSSARNEVAVELADNLVATLRSSVRSDEANVTSILEWPGWKEVDDAVLVDRNLRDDRGALRPRGVLVHPVGSSRRDPGLDMKQLLAELEACVVEEQEFRVAGGRALPIAAGNNVWGAVWLRMRGREDVGQAVQTLLPWFMLSTVLLTGGTFLAVRRLVLVPVERLVAGSDAVRRGDLSARVPETGRDDELGELIVSFNAMTARVEGFNRELEQRVTEATAQARRAEHEAMIQRRLAAMGELAAGIAHEINNPLGGLLNAVEALRREELPDERRARYLDLLRDGLERIGITVGQVLRMAPRETRPDRVELLDVVEDALALVRHRAESEGVTIERVVDEGAAPTTVLGARNELGQALLNLLVNALDALADRGRPGRVTIRLSGDESESPPSLRLSVQDDGPGVDAETLERATDLFFSTKEVGRGSGLGLSIVHNVADSHGGRLELASEVGRFFRATLVVPRARREGRT
ncbi:sensor histidine kinase [Engelhardtia mirabilis]|uniref:histidine kinase n=1 Tax=Engelhardtia mirabilis TaxID=2528011 RepID=A0A518BJ64_9BACT|nr:Sensor protein ZraS [Planctomycetes bacterium Pla133]QDV01335.1 Sensor protein ZraS [Planctomycetes bacterium Pla86]